MKQIKLKIIHRGCWASECTAKCRGVKLIHTGTYIILKKKKSSMLVQNTWQVCAKSEKDLNRFFAVLKKYPLVEKFEVIKRIGVRALIFVKYHIKYSQFEMALSKGAIPGEAVVIEDGIEYHHFLTETREMMDELLEKIKDDKEVTIISIGQSKETKGKFGLTEKQREALRLAAMYEYYRWPRRLTLEELAKIAGLSRKVFQDHLRKAEAKIFPQLIQDIITE